VGKYRGRCPKCGARVDYESAVGDSLVCPACHARLRVPAHARAVSPSRAPTLAGQTSQPAPADPLIGKTLGEFEIVGVIGRGGMGAVYKARQPSLGRFVAIKVLPKRFAEDASFVERFSREARSAAAIRHPNIIEVFVIGQDKGHQYIAMEFIEGESLADLLKRESKLPPDRALDLMKQVASALAKAHSLGIVHRDIKPANILLTSEGMAKVADFGLAKREGVDVSVTVTGASLGTPLYMAPEVARGQPADPRSDLYSLGATFYQAIAGKPPFDGATPAELIVKHVNTPPPPLQSLAPDCPAPFCRIIHRLLAKNPAHRYSSAEKLLEAIERLEERLAQKAAGPQPEPKPTTRRRQAPPQRPPPPLPLVVGGCAVAATILLVVLIVALGGRRRRTQATHPTTQDAIQKAIAARMEQNAETVFNNARVCLERKEYEKARGYLDRLAEKYATTQFYAARKSDITALREQIDAYIKGPPPLPKPKTSKPTPPKPIPPKPKTTTPPRPAPGPPPDGDERWTEWEDLFDGTSLHAWLPKGSGWRIQPEGVLGWQKGCGHLWTRQQFDDFELDLEFTLAKGSNSGVFVRTANPRDPVKMGLEVQLVDSYGEKPLNSRTTCGAIYGVLAPKANPVRPPGEWNRLRIRSEGDALRVILNGTVVVDAAMARHGRPMERAGHIVLQDHGTPVWFRSIRLRRLKPYIESKEGSWRIYLKWPFDEKEAKRRQVETAKALGVPVEQDIDLGKGVKMTLVLIPAGEFLMGNKEGVKPEELQKTYGGDLDWYRRELFARRRRTVERPFWLGKTEVTQAQWQQVVGSNPSRGKVGPQLPVDNVSWDDCQRFVEKLSGRLNTSSRLPSEAEWEWACRAGADSEFYFGVDPSELPSHAFFEANAGGSAQPVGMKAANAWGLHDMLGSVWEYCQDRYSSQYEPGEEDKYVSRGGSWNCNSGRCRVSARTRTRSSYKGAGGGLRVVVDIRASAAQPQPKPPGPAGARATPKIDVRDHAVLRSVEANLVAWDFAGAAAELAKLVGGASLPRVQQMIAV